MIAADFVSILAYTPFLQPLPVWDYWMLLLVPLTIGVSVVYKSIKCREMKDVPREATQISVMILVGMAVAAALLYVIVRVREAMV
jgi:hypothetical protein